MDGGSRLCMTCPLCLFSLLACGALYNVLQPGPTVTTTAAPASNTTTTTMVFLSQTPQQPIPGVPIDCSDSYRNWLTEWTAEKKSFCCQFVECVPIS
mmetsp:Transcript_112104/g.317504  ORF Transcript_112104/g.317504 Transcript_112104/m.317504 type:complete len:97 (-) Transcript_112104:265-555(-)